MIENSSDIITVLDLDGTIRFESPSFERLLGYAQHEIDGRIAFDFIHPDDLPAVLEKFQLIVQRPGETHTAEFRFRHRDGFWHQFEGVGRTARDSHDRPCVIVNSRDITERKREEEERLNHEMMLSLMLNTGPGCIKRVASDGTLLHMNRAGLHMIEACHEEDAIGLSVFDLVVSEHRASFIEMHQAVIKGCSRMLQFEIIGLQGTRRWMETYAAPFQNPITGRTEQLAVTHDVTERKRAEQSLLQTRDLLTSFVENTPAAVAMLDRELRYVAVSRRWLTDYRLGDEPLMGRRHYDVFPEIQDMKEWQDIHQRCLSGSVERREEDRFVRADGSEDWLRWEVRPWHDITGEIGGIIIFTEVITERKQAEAALRVSEERLALAVEGSTDILWDAHRLPGEPWYASQTPIWWSPRVRGLLDLEESELFETLGQWAMRLHPDDKDWVFGKLAAHVEHRVPYDAEYRLRTNRGDYLWIRARGQASWDEQGEIRRMSGSCQDITDRKHAEEALRVSKERYARATAVGRVGVWELDVATGTYYGDTNLKALFGYRDEELSTDPYDWLNLVHPDDRSIAMEHWQRIVRGEADGYNYELRMVKKDGAVIWTDVRGHAVRDPEGQVKYLFGATVDITDRRLVQDALAKSERQLRTVLDALPVGVWLTDQEGEALLFNPAAKEIWSSIKRAGRQNPGVMTRWPESLEAVGEPLRRALDVTLTTGIASLNETMELECVDGTRRIVRNSTIPVQNEEGMAFGAVVLTEDITTLRQTEADLKLTQFSVDHALEGFLWISSDGRILNANDTVCRLLEYSHEELLAMTVYDIDPHVSSEVWSAYWNALTRKGSLSFESRYWSQTGRIHEMDVTANYLHYGDREYSCTILRDIGERKRAIEALRESEERFSKAFNEAAIGMALVGTDGCWLQVNRALCNIVGYSKEELEATTFQAVTHPDDLDADLTLLRQLLEGEISTYQMKKRYLHKQGHIVWIVLSVSLVRHPNGEPQHLISQMQDITDRKQAEEALALSERRLRTVLDTLPVGVWFTDSAGRVQFGNPASHRMWGGAAYIGLPRQGKEEWWEPSAGGYVPHRWALAGALSNGESSFQDKMMIRYVDGTTKTIMNTSVPVRGDAGQVMGAIVVTEDITESTRLAQREAARIQQLRQLSELSLTLSGDPTAIFTRVVRMIGELFKVRVVCLSEIVGQELHFKAVYADGCVMIDAGHCPLIVTPCATVQMDKDVRLFDSVMERFPQASFLRDHRAVSYCGFPALDSAGRVVAVTCLLDDKPHEFSDEEQDLLRIFGQRIATEFERHRHVAEQQRVADELRRSHAFLRQVIDTDPNFIFAKDRAGRFTLANQAVAEAYGTTVENLIGKTYADFNSNAEGAEFFRKQDVEVMDSGRDRFILEEPFTGARGHTRWLQTIKRPIFDNEGRVTMVLGAATDVTERKRIAEDLARSRAQIQAILDNSPAVIFMKDLEGRYLLSNRPFETITHQAGEAILGKADEELFPPEQAAAFRANDGKVLEAGVSLQFEEVVRHNDGPHTSLVCKFPLRNSDGHVYAIGGIVTDITERKRIEEELRERERALRAAVEERERISEDLHDGILQSIFAVGLGLESCRTLIAELPLPRKKATAPLMAALNRAIGQLNHVMTDVRNFIAGIESHVLQGGDVGSTLRAMVQAMCASNGTPCRVTIEEAAVRELSTEEAYHVMNVMREALSNSLRHSGAGRITLSFKQLRRSVRLSVTDNGKGFVPDSVRDVGHGLINMAARARKLGGRIEVRSRPRQGTKVLLDIPRRPVDE